MNYIDDLTQDEKVELCTIISGRWFRELFKSNEQEFTKLRKGFRAKSLTEEAALSTAIANVDKPFIVYFIQRMADGWLNEIRENTKKLEKEGTAHDNAVASALLDSELVDNVRLYLKLAGQASDEEACSKLVGLMGDMKRLRTKDAETVEKMKSIEEENQRLSAQCEAASQKINEMQSEYEQKLKTLEQEKAILASELEKMQERRAISETVLSNRADELAAFDDTNASVLPSENNGEIVSVCRIFTDYNGQKWLMRCADLNHNGEYQIFQRERTLPPFFSNRDKIFFKDGPSDDGEYGIWTWTARPNEKDASKDFIESRYNQEIDVIEIAIIGDAINLEGIVERLKAGVAIKPHSRRTLFACRTVQGKYVGVLVERDWIDYTNESISLQKECYVVPVYEFYAADIMRLDNGDSFYSRAFLGVPKHLYRVKRPIEIVQDVVYDSISWSAYKERGGMRADYSAFKNFLGIVPTEEVIRQIEEKLRCSISAAEDLLNKFLSSAEKYLNGDSLEDKIISSALFANQELQKRAKDLIRTDWEAENLVLIEETKKKIDLLNDELEKREKRLEEASERLERIRAEEKIIEDAIGEKQKLAENVEKSVAERIRNARKNAADFIAEFAFVGGQSVCVSDTAANTLYKVCRGVEVSGDTEEIDSWESAIGAVSIELHEAGVADEYANCMAAFLCAAYLKKQPLLLVGPNALQIVEAFSAAVALHKYGILNCNGSYDGRVIKEIGSNGEDIVIINNILESRWINRLPEILSGKDVFYIVIHPYAEDIQVEPKSLYDFVLPLFTEVFVDKRPTGKDYHCGYFKDEFNTAFVPQRKQRELTILSKLSLSPYVSDQISDLVSIMCAMAPSVSSDELFLSAGFPVAFASMEMSPLRKIIYNESQGFTVSKKMRSKLQSFIGEEE